MSFRLFKPKWPERRKVVGPDGKPVMAKNKAGKLVPQREIVRDAAGKPVYREAAKWYVEVVGRDGERHRVPGYADKAATQQLAAELDKKLARKDSGFADRFEEHRKRPLAEHLKDWHADKLANISKARADVLFSRASRVVEGCRFKRWGDISASRVSLFVANLRKEPEGLNIQTSNSYLQSIKQFCRWMVADGRAAETPLAHLKGGNPKQDPRRLRRALSEDELRRLIDAAVAGPETYGVSGRVRGVLYRLVAETGLRQNEARTLVPEACNLDGKPPMVTVRAAYSKRGQEDHLPLLPALAAVLRPLVAATAPGGPVFPVPEDRKRMMRMYRADLDAAEIAYQDDQGRYADFHALRHTFITNLAKAGTALKTTMDLARHSDPKLTMDRYSHTRLADRAEALEGLPDLDARPDRESLRATGTDDIPGRPDAEVAKGSNSPSGISSGISFLLSASGQDVSAAGQTGEQNSDDAKCEKPNDSKPLSASDTPMSSTGQKADGRSRTGNGSFTKAVLPERKPLIRQGLTESEGPCISPAYPNDPAFERIRAAWLTLPEVVRAQLASLAETLAGDK